MMEGSASAFRQSKTISSLNPWVLHLQKLGLELKCPLCLGFFDRPTLLPCNHIVCKGCLPNSAQFPLPCPQCQTLCSVCDLRPAPYIENMVAIYKRMDMTFHASLSWNSSIGAASVPDSCMTSANREDSKEPVQIARDGHGEGKEPPKFSGEIMTSVGFGNSNSPQRRLRAEEIVGGRTVEIDMNHVENTSLGSPPCSGTRSLDDESSDQGSDQTPVKHSATRSAGPVFRNRPRTESDDGSILNTVGHVRDCKRQKKMDKEGDSRSAAGVDNYISVKAGSRQESCSPSPQSADDTKKSSPNIYLCAFCSASTTSEASGEMLHYVNGQPVEGEQVANQNVMHVHRKCIEWAPQVYFEGEKVKNLEKEVARGAKLKCVRCGLKGAALGCYVKSCRMTYHAPCAAEVSGCRWDCEDFLMLCPAHASAKFPNEKLKLRNSKLASSALPQKTSDSRQPENWQDSYNKAKSWALCGSSLSPEDKSLLLKFAKMIGVSVSKLWSPEVTHVVAATDEKGACTWTFKVLMAILHGKWVLKIDWIKACMEAMCPVDEEPYEVGCDNHGSSNGPKLGRLRTLNNDPKLFDRLKFYLAGNFIPAFARDLRILICAGGGEVLTSKEELIGTCDDREASTELIVFNPEPPEGIQLGEEVSIYWQKINEAEELATSSGCKVVTHMWVLESVAACELLPFVDLSSQFAA
ncbi:BRCA1-associated RING domain protein 1 [Punica granatum]|uniref:RING-type E3 ubiquitin transferase BRCA1 n=1 Tax=Punica granatum TaxID=22663 RepID=A0A6P8DJH3_PUNGR|nr:BRCA1-associated RING domain protein 1 [Punica granatum]